MGGCTAGGRLHDGQQCGCPLVEGDLLGDLKPAGIGKMPLLPEILTIIRTMQPYRMGFIFQARSSNMP